MLIWIVPHNMVVSHIFLKAIIIKVMYTNSAPHYKITRGLFCLVTVNIKNLPITIDLCWIPSADHPIPSQTATLYM